MSMLLQFLTTWNKESWRNPHNPAISGCSPLFTCSVAEQLLAHGGLKNSWHRQIYEVIRRYAGNAARPNCQGSSVHVDQQMVCFNLQEMFIHFYFRMVFEARTICLTWPFRELLEGDIMLWSKEVTARLSIVQLFTCLLIYRCSLRVTFVRVHGFAKVCQCVYYVQYTLSGTYFVYTVNSRIVKLWAGKQMLVCFHHGEPRLDNAPSSFHESWSLNLPRYVFAGDFFVLWSLHACSEDISHHVSHRESIFPMDCKVLGCLSPSTSRRIFIASP